MDAQVAGAGRTARPHVFLNGKFYSGATNGVHRVADRLIRELDRLASAGEAPAGWDMRLLLPDRGTWAPDFGHVVGIPQKGGHTQAWEQFVLPIAARSGVLASFANLAPALHPNKLTMVHDAQFRVSPSSYPARLRWGYRALVPLGARSSRMVLTVSDYARDNLATFGIAGPARLRTVHNGGDHILEVVADHSVLAEHGLTRGAYALLFGSTARYKNVQVAFDAFARADLAGLQIAVIGPDRARLEAAGLTVPRDAVFVGGVDDARLRSLYENAHCLLYPSRTEGFGLPPVEAMLCGCPVISAPAGAMPEICRDAVLYAGLDAPGEWADALLALRSSDLRLHKIAAGVARARGFTWSAAGRRVAAAIAELVARSSGGSRAN